MWFISKSAEKKQSPPTGVQSRAQRAALAQAVMPEMLESRLLFSGYDTSRATLFAQNGNLNSGQSAAFTIDVGVPLDTDYSVSPTGTVSLVANGVTLDTEAVPTSGVVSVTSSSLPAGVDTVTAYYPGDANFASSTSDPVTMVVNGTAANEAVTTLQAPPSSILQGTSISMKVTVAPALAGGPTPTGIVHIHFKADNDWQDYPLTLDSSGNATFTNSDLPANFYDVTASYAGDSTYAVTPSATYPLDVNTSGITSTILRSTLAPSLVIGKKATGKIFIKLTNTLDSRVREYETIDIYALESDTLQLTGDVIASLNSKLVSLAPGRSVIYPLTASTQLAGLDQGSYQLVAEVSGTDSDLNYSAPGPNLTVAEPFISFADSTLTSGLNANTPTNYPTTARSTVVLVNSGNIIAKGNAVVKLYASPDGTVASGTELGKPMTVPVSLLPGKKKTVRILPKTIPNLADGTYQIIAEVTDPDGTVTITNGGSVMMQAPFVAMTPSFVGSYLLGGQVARIASVSATVLNTGNIPAKGNGQVQLYSSADGTLTGATLLSTHKFGGTLAVGHVLKVHFSLSKTNAALAAEGSTLVIVVTDPNGAVTKAVES